MKNLTSHIVEHFEIVNEANAKGLFVVKTGMSQETLGANYAPSVTYNMTSEFFTNLSDAKKEAKTASKLAKQRAKMNGYTEPNSGTATTYVSHVYNIEKLKGDPDKWTAPLHAEKAGAILIK